MRRLIQRGGPRLWPSFESTRVELRPADPWPWRHGAAIGGHYQLGVTCGTFSGVANGGIIAAFRVASANMLCVLERVQANIITTTAFTAPQLVAVSLRRCTAWTVSDTGGTGVTPVEPLRSIYPNSVISTAGDIRTAGAAALGAGTRTQDGFDKAKIDAWSGGAGVSLPMTDLLPAPRMFAGPLVLKQNEGFELLWRNAMGAAGVVAVDVLIQWLEVEADTTGGW